MGPTFGQGQVIGIDDNDQQGASLGLMALATRMHFFCELVNDPEDVSAVDFAARVTGEQVRRVGIESALLKVVADELFLEVVLTK